MTNSITTPAPFFTPVTIERAGLYFMSGKVIINGNTEDFKIQGVEIGDTSNVEAIVIKAIYAAKRKDPRFYEIQNVKVEVCNFKMPIFIK